jgi:excisionase family DNA binding protein
LIAKGPNAKGRLSVTLAEAADQLGVHYMTVYRYVRTGRLPARRVAGVWLVDPADLDLVRRTAHSTRPSRPTDPVPSRARLEARLVTSDEAGAWAIVEAALASGMEPDDLLLELVAPTLCSIGARWEHGELSVADEHQASAVTTRLIGRLGGRFARRGVRRGTVVLAAPAGELHALPVAIAANLLRWRGFDVVELGADTPTGALVEAVANEPGLLAMGLACTTDGSLGAARRAITEIRLCSPNVPVLLGGAAIAGASHAREAGADVCSGKRGDELVNAVESIAGERH